MREILGVGIVSNEEWAEHRREYYDQQHGESEDKRFVLRDPIRELARQRFAPGHKGGSRIGHVTTPECVD